MRQLRVYTLKPGSTDRFVAAWKGGVLPLRGRFGYVIEGAWLVPGRATFVWILRHDGGEPWEELERRYYGSPERESMNPDPRPFIARAENYFLESVLD
ncbi:MAG: hypothetical protein ACRDG5_02030 [Anaerolineales bacterium]